MRPGIPICERHIGNENITAALPGIMPPGMTSAGIPPENIYPLNIPNPTISKVSVGISCTHKRDQNNKTAFPQPE